MELLRELKNMGKTILISSHILSELHNLCDEVVIIESGKLLFAGRIEDAGKKMRQGKIIFDVIFAEAPDDQLTELEAWENLSVLKKQGNMVVFELGEGVQSADVIAHCLEKGLRVEEARKHQTHLDEIFMNITKA